MPAPNEPVSRKRACSLVWHRAGNIILAPLIRRIEYGNVNLPLFK